MRVFKAHLTGSCQAIISALYWGEIAGVTCKLRGRPDMDMALARLEALGLGVVPAASERAVRAALIKLNRNIPYVDAFGVELAASSSGQVLVTADFDLKAASKDVKIEFLPSK